MQPSPPWRRFALAAAAGVLVALPGYLWAACDLWNGHWSLLRYLPYEANFFDLQARALLAGHLYLPAGSIGIEAFVHGGHQYTYFGLFPSLVRLPVILLTRRLDARMTVPSMLLAWLVTALCTALLTWRVRCFLRGGAALGRAEAASLGAVVAAVCGGSVLVALAATPYVFDEDLAWSVALALASLFLLLGLLERPSARRLVGCGLAVAAANLDRVTTGWGCVLAVLALAAWFALGRAGERARRLALPLAGIGVLAFAAGAAVNWAKFGQPVGLPMQDQVFSLVNAYRRRFLAANGGEVGLQFLPSDALAYLRPDGLRLGSAFPFVTAPGAPAGVVGRVLFDRTYPTPSVTASMPMLFLLACWGALHCCLRGRDARTRSLLPLLAGAAASAGAILLWGYIADRYLADFLPLLVLAGAVGAVDLWRRLDARSRSSRRAAAALFVLFAAVEVVVNLGVAAAPNDEWNGAQTANFVAAQIAIGTLGGPPLGARLVHGPRLPAWAPAGSLFEVGDCDGLYVSNGESFASVPLQEYQHATWMPVDEGAPYRKELTLRFARPAAGGAVDVPLLAAGPSRLSVRLQAYPGATFVQFVLADPRFAAVSEAIAVVPGAREAVTVVADPQLHQLTVTMAGIPYLDGPLTGGDRVTVPAAAAGPVAATDVTRPAAEDALCRRLAGAS